MLNKEKFVKWFMAFTAVALVISLVINFKLLTGLNQLENDVNTISNNQHTIKNSVHNQKNEISNLLTDTLEEQRLISNISMDLGNKAMEEGAAKATFEWQVRELQEDSKVVFNYAYGDTKDYTAVPAEELQNGLFQVNVPFEVEAEPQWSTVITGSQSDAQREMGEEMIKVDNRGSDLSYFISVSDNGAVKSGDIQTDNLGYLGTELYGINHAEVNIVKDTFSIALNHDSVSESTKAVEKAYLLKYAKETLQGKQEIIMKDEDNDDPKHRSRFFYLDQIEQYDDMRLVIKVTYSNGETFEKEVY